MNFHLKTTIRNIGKKPVYTLITFVGFTLGIAAGLLICLWVFNVDPGASLEGKIIPEEWADTRNYIFLTFTKDNYDCPNTRKDKKVKIYYALFSKKSGELQIIKGDPTDYGAPILENDIDGGYPVWPSAYMVGNKGELVISLKGSNLKSHVKSVQFQRSTAPVEKKEKLKQVAASVADQDDVLMIVK